MTNKSKEYVLDTHAWIQAMTGDESISAYTRDLMERAAAKGNLYVSAFSVWEVARLVKEGTLILHQPCSQWVAEALERSHIQLIPFSPEIALESCQLPGDKHHTLSPSAQVILATARVADAVLLTAEENCLVYGAAGYAKVLDIRG